MKSTKIDFKSWFYKNCKRQRKAKAKICQVCPFREYIELMFHLWKNDGDDELLECDEYFPDRVERKYKQLQAELEINDGQIKELEIDYADLKEVQLADYAHAVRNCETASKLEAENRQLKERYEDQERLWKLANQDNCEGDCDKESPHKQCAECLARSVINECGEIFGDAIREIKQNLEESDR